MECNKDEAIRAKQLAEKKLIEKDILGAKRFASKAQSLFPGLEGLSQLQEILDVYVASQKKVNGEVDWYEIFGVDPFADDETIRKTYRKLALALHPDKNKSVGADGAFKIISEAWSLLSDKAKRNAYNEKRNIRASCQRARDGNPPPGSGKRTYKNFTNSSSKPRNPATQDKSQQDIKASSKKGRGKNPPAGAEKNSYNHFTDRSSSKINPTQDKHRQDTRPSYDKASGGNPPVGAGNSRCDNLTDSSSNKINPATSDKVQQDTRSSNQKAPDQNLPAAGGKSGYNNFSNGISGIRNTATPKHPQTGPASRRANRKTFWTSCKTCMMQYEYVHIYRNQKLLCPNCRKPFLAREMPPPHAMGKKASTKVPCRQKQKYPNDNAFDTSTASERKSMGTSGYLSKNSMVKGDTPQVSSSRCDDARSESRSVKSAGQLAQNFQSTDPNLKRRHGEGINGAVNEETVEKCTASAKPESDIRPNFSKEETAAKRSRINEQMSHVGESGSQMGSFGSEKINIFGSKKITGFTDLSQSETRNMLMYKTKMAILMKKSEFGAGSSEEVCKYMEKQMPNRNASGESIAHGMKKEEKMNTAFHGANSSAQVENSLTSSLVTNSDTKATKILAVTVPVSDELKESSFCAVKVVSDWKVTESMVKIVPDSDFIDFDKDSAKNSIAENQVWAAYDDEDGMPRFYALVQGVTSSHPSKVKVSWLNSRSTAELGILNWVHSGFSKTCGNFRISRHEVDVEVNSFSHIVKYTKFAKGLVQIFPRKGDVWALYRSWSSDWNELTPDDVIQKYDMVEVLEDYGEDYGVLVAPLVKVAGFKSVFHQHLDPRKIYTIPRDEIFRFSHQVPSCFLTGQSGEKRVPKGCRELDPAAMPEELLQVITKSEEEEMESMLHFGEDERRAKVGKDEGTAKECMESVNQILEGTEI